MQNNFLSPAEIVDCMIDTGYKKANLIESKTVLLSILAGMFISLGAFGSSIVSFSQSNLGTGKLIAGLVFPVGLMLVLICGAELFTGNTVLTAAYAEGKITLKQVIKNWLIVFIGNFIGSIIIVVLIYMTGLLDTGTGESLLGAYALKTATAKVNLNFTQALTRGILCNILVVLAVWMAAGCKDIISKLFACWFPVMLFVLSSYEHCIANMYFIPIGILCKGNSLYSAAAHLDNNKLMNLTWENFFVNNLIPVTIGNIIGGAFVVALAYWVIYKKIGSSKVQVEQNKKIAT